MRLADRPRLRQLATLLVFTLGVVATAATSAAYPTIEVPPQNAGFRLDDAHPAAMSRILFRASAEATAQSPRYEISVAPYGALSGVRLIVTSTPPRVSSPGAPAGSPPVASPASAVPAASPSGSAPPAGTWQADITSSSAMLPIDCGAGPCERTYWVLAVLTEPSSLASVNWTVGGRIGWSQSALPAGARASMTIDPPTALTPPASSLTASTDGETIDFGPERPAAARVVEVTADAAVIGDGRTPSAALTVDVVRTGPTAADATGLLVHVFALDGPLAVVAGPSDSAPTAAAVLGAPGGAIGGPPAGPTPLAGGADPFAGCAPDRSCTRRVLVTFALVQSGYPSPARAEVRPFTWQLTLRRTDLLAAWTRPATMGARVTRRIDIAEGTPPQSIRREGDINAQSLGTYHTATAPYTTSSTSTDPLAALLPVPATATLTVPLPAAWTDPQGTDVSLGQQVAGQPGPTLSGTLVNGALVVQDYPMSATSSVCRIGMACPDLDITVASRRTTDATPPPGLTYHWTLDLRVFSYADFPVTATKAPSAP